MLTRRWNQISRQMAARLHHCAKFVCFCACVCHVMLMRIVRVNFTRTIASLCLCLCLFLCLRRTCKPGFNEQKQSLCTCVSHFGTLLCRPLQKNNVKWPNLRFCGERGTQDGEFFISFLNLYATPTNLVFVKVERVEIIAK